MKQNITKEQFEELGEAGRTRLWEWIEDGHDRGNLEPLLSIGQMIEFLAEQKDQLFHPLCYPLYEASGMKWDREGPMSGEPDVEDLCDSLWDACKEILSR